VISVIRDRERVGGERDEPERQSRDTHDGLRALSGRDPDRRRHGARAGGVDADALHVAGSLQDLDPRLPDLLLVLAMLAPQARDRRDPSRTATPGAFP
jgi:hypothetical protein